MGSRLQIGNKSDSILLIGKITTTNNNNICPGSPLAYAVFSGALQIIIYKKNKIKISESLSKTKKFKS